MPTPVQKAVFPGSFDPFTLGHLELVERASHLFEDLVVLLAHNSAKAGFLPLEDRLRLARRAVEHLPNVQVDAWEGLTVDYLRKSGARWLVRGVRGAPDLEWEKQMAWTNSALYPGCDTVFLASNPGFSHVSSTLVREILKHGGDISTLVPKEILADLQTLSHQAKC